MSNDNLPLIQHSDAYADRFVVLDPASHTLAVKNYNLFNSTQAIPLNSLRYIFPAREVIHRWSLKEHGYSPRYSIRWAKDHTRGNGLRGPRSGYDRSFVVQVEDTSTRCGFSVEEPDRFLAVLEKLRPGITKTMYAPEEDEQHVDDDLISDL